MKDIIELIRQRLNGARLDDCISPLAHKEVMELVDKLAQLQQHSVMQAEGSDVSEGATVGNGAAGQSGCDGLFYCKHCKTQTIHFNGECVYSD